MSRDSSGAYSLPAAYNPVVTQTTILSAWANTTLADIAGTLTDSLDRNGRGAMLAALQHFDGTSLIPGINWATETNSGRYRVSTGVFAEIINAVEKARIDATNGLQVPDAAAGTMYPVGWRYIPQVSKSVAYTMVLADSGKHIYHPGADTTARIWTIPANASVAYPIGTALTFINDTLGGVITISITSDTLVLAGPGTTGSRTLAASGCATAVKTTATRWIISGTGLT